MNQRVLKQLLYLLFYLAIIGVAIFLIYLWAVKPGPTCFDNRQNQGETGIDCGGPCQPCEIKYLKPLEAQKIRFFEAQNKTIVTAEITNPNQNFGADKFTYTINFYNQEGIKIGGLANDSFIYAAEIKSIFEIDEKIDFSDIYNISVNFSNIHWVSKEDFQRPFVELREQKFVAEKPLKLKGVVVNQSNFEISLKLIVFIYDRYGIQLGASKTETEKLGAQAQKDFQIILPPDISEEQIDQSQTKIFIEARP